MSLANYTFIMNTIAKQILSYLYNFNVTKWRMNGEVCLYWFYGIHLFSDVTILTRKITSRFLILNSELYFNWFIKNCIAVTIIQNNHPCIQLVFEYIAMLAQVCQILNFFMCLLFFGN